MKKVFLYLIIGLMFSSFVLALNDTNLPRLDIQILNQNPDPVEPGKYVEVRFIVENIGGGDTSDFIFELIPQYPFSLDPGSDIKRKIGGLNSYQIGDYAYVMFYNIRVDSNAVVGDSQIRYRYSTDNGKNWITLTNDIRIDEREYLISVNDVLTEPEKVIPGKEFDLNFKIKNLAFSEINNVKVTLNLEQLSEELNQVPFFTKGVANHKVLETISASKEKDVNFKLIVDPNAQTKLYRLPITIDYNNNKGERLSKDFFVTINVFDKPQYLINLEDSEIYKNNQRGRIIVSVSNIGTSKLNFLRTTLQESEDYTIISPNNVYLGNLESDDFETSDYQIFVNSDKSEINLNLLVEYKDELNNVYSENKNVALKLYDGEDLFKFNLEERSKNTNQIIFFMVILLLSVFWIFMLIDVIKSNQEMYKKVIWIALIVLTFVLGAITYYMFGRSKRR
ncbi:MAG: PLDc N-terminal domain-containing protein [bacterium]